jgi:hypothetical protein
VARRDREPSKSAATLRDEATKGIGPDVLTQHEKDGVCLRRGKAGHMWTDCWSKEPNKRRADSRTIRRPRGQNSPLLPPSRPEPTLNRLSRAGFWKFPTMTVTTLSTSFGLKVPTFIEFRRGKGRARLRIGCLGFLWVLLSLIFWVFPVSP